MYSEKEVLGIIYFFDLSDSSSFINIEQWIKECKKYGGDKLSPLLIGNKADKKKAVSTSDIEKLCNSYKLYYSEVSALNKENIVSSIEEFAGRLLNIASTKKK